MIMKRIVSVLVAAASIAAMSVFGGNADVCACPAAAAAYAARTSNVETVIFKTKLHCENCAKKVTENISYVKGVKDLAVSLEKQEIMIKFDANKTNVGTLQKEIQKLGYPAVVKNQTK